MRSKILPVALALICATSYAEKKSLKEGIKDAGRTVGEAAHEVGHGTRDAAKVVGKTVKEVARDTGHAVRDGAREVKKAAKGADATDAKRDRKK